MVDMAIAPQRLEQRIAEAQRQQVLHRFLAEKMIDAEHPRLVEYAADSVIDLVGGFQAVAQGLFQHDTGFGIHQPGRLQMQGGGCKQVGQRGQVEYPRPARLITQVPGQPGELDPLADVQSHVVQTLGKALPALLVEVGLGHVLADMPAHQFTVAVPFMPGAGQRQDAGIGMQMTITMQVEQGRQQLAHGQIPGAAEYHDVAGLAISR